MFLIIVAYIYSTTTNTITNQQYLMNCPSPINHGVASAGNPFLIGGIRLNYTVSITGSPNSDYNGTFFDCSIVNNSPAVSFIIKVYGKTLFTAFPQGWFAWVGDTVWSYLDNIQPFITMIYLLVVMPSAIGALTFFSYINIFMTVLIAFGIFLAVRG